MRVSEMQNELLRSRMNLSEMYSFSVSSGYVGKEGMESLENRPIP